MKKLIKIICILLMVLLLINNSSNINAEVNNNYDSNITVDDEGLEDKITNSAMADAIGALVYALASAVEDLIGWVFKLLTGDKIFPWADRVIFNAIPFLDINFLNPSDNSLFLSGGVSTMLSDIVHDVYFTILTLAIGFLGVVVAITAIKLAISTIASEKSKYKQAIVNWLFAIIMLFTVHFILSFVFYLNEKLVEVASYMITSDIGKTEFGTDNARFEMVYEIKGIYCTGSEAFCSDLYKYRDSENKANYKLVDEITGLNLVSNDLFVEYFENNPYKSINYNVIQEAIDSKRIIGNINGNSVLNDTQIQNDVKEMMAYLQACEKICYDEFKCTTRLNYFQVGPYIKQYIYEKKYNEFDGYLKMSPFIWLSRNYNIDIIKQAFEYIKIERNLVRNFNDYEELYLKFRSFGDFCNKVSVTDYGVVVSDSNMIWAKDVLANMGEFFRELAWQDGWIFKRITFQGALLYTIFLTQSVLFLIAYTKRFFYVIILSIMAPIVVIYDFMIKSMS